MDELTKNIVERLPPVSQVTQESFADRMEQVYGTEGLDKRAAIVNKRLKNRPHVLDAAGMYRFTSPRALDRVPAVWSNQAPAGMMGPVQAKSWGNEILGAYDNFNEDSRRLGGPADTGRPETPTAFIWSPTGEKPDNMFVQRPFADSIGSGNSWDVPTTYGAGSGATMHNISATANHELGHHVYMEPESFIQNQDVLEAEDIARSRHGAPSAQEEAFGDIMPSLNVLGAPGSEIPVYLADVVRWYANRNLDPEKLANDPEYRLNAKRDIPVTDRDHEKAWDAFGGMLKERENPPFNDDGSINYFHDILLDPENKSGNTWGPFNYERWQNLNTDREKVLRILPELVQTSDFQSNITA